MWTTCVLHSCDAAYFLTCVEHLQILLLTQDVDNLYTKYRRSLKPGESVCYFDDFCDLVGADGYNSFARYIFDRMRKDLGKGIGASAFIVGVYHFCSVTKEGLPLFLFQIFSAGMGEMDFDGITKMIRRIYDSKHTFDTSGKKILAAVRKNYGGVLTKITFGRFALTYTSFMFPVFQLHRSMRQRILGKRTWRRIQRARAMGKVAALPSRMQDDAFTSAPPIAPSKESERPSHQLSTLSSPPRAPPKGGSERPTHELTLFESRFERSGGKKTKTPPVPPFPLPTTSRSSSNTSRIDDKPSDARFATTRRCAARSCAQCGSKALEGGMDQTSDAWYCRTCWGEYERTCDANEEGLAAGVIVGAAEQEEDDVSATPVVVVGVAIDEDRLAAKGSPPREGGRDAEMSMAEYPLDTTGDGEVDMIGFDSNGNGQVDLVGIMNQDRSKIERVVPVVSMDSTKQAAIFKALDAIVDDRRRRKVGGNLGRFVGDHVVDSYANDSSSNCSSDSSNDTGAQTLCAECGESRAIFDGAEDEGAFAKDAVVASEPLLNFTVPSSYSFGKFRSAAKELLKIPANPGGYDHARKYRQKWQTYDPSTRKVLNSIEDLAKSKGPAFASREGGEESSILPPPSGMFYLLEGGVFVHFGLREGTVQYVTHVPTVAKKPTALKTLSMRPLLFEVEGYLSDEECKHVIDLTESKMGDLRESGVIKMDHDKGKETKQWRTSSQLWLKKGETETTRLLADRASDLTGTLNEQQESTQVLRYLNSQFYSAHLDAFNPKLYQSYIENIEWGHKNRLLTLFWYMSDVDEGGETHFPRAYGLPQPHDFWECDASRGLKVKPQKGNIILWYNLLPNGVLDEDSLHGGCPVKGEATKWSANVWIWNKNNGYGDH
eukprot:g2232.t1